MFQVLICKRYAYLTFIGTYNLESFVKYKCINLHRYFSNYILNLLLKYSELYIHLCITTLKHNKTSELTLGIYKSENNSVELEV